MRTELRNNLIEEYFEWLVELAYNERYMKKNTYNQLFRALYSTSFNYMLEMDANRADDGVQLRYRFGRERGGIHEAQIAHELDIYDCSVLEMMVALSLRCEEEVMVNDDFGNRTGRWFWSMITSLGLVAMDDQHFNRERYEIVMQRFLTRDYSKNGAGGLFTLRSRYDLRTVEIWYQAMWYLDSVLKKEGGY